MLKKLEKIYIEIVRTIVFFVPPFIMFFLGILYLGSEFNAGKFPIEKYTFLLSAIGLTAGFSATCFQASSSAKDKKKKNIYFSAGERLMHSSFLFVYVLVLKFFSDNIEKYWLFSYLDLSAKFLLGGLGSVLLFYGIAYLVSTLGSLNKFLFKGNAEPLG